MELTVEKRDIKASPHTLRQKGVLPAVVYGRKDASTPISVDRKTFEKLYKQAGESSVITLKGLGETKDVLIHDVAVHPVSGEALHADFYAIAAGQTVTVSVPLQFEGVSPAVKDLGGILVKVMHELEIECPPKDLPHSIVVDISKLTELDSQVKVADLKVPASAKLSIDTDEVVAMIDVAKEEVEEVPAADLSAIEISEDRGKKEEEGEGEAGASTAEAPKAAAKEKKE